MKYETPIIVKNTKNEFVINSLSGKKKFIRNEQKAMNIDPYKKLFNIHWSLIFKIFLKICEYPKILHRMKKVKITVLNIITNELIII